MKKHLAWLAVLGDLAILAPPLGSASYGAHITSNWVGENNAPPDPEAQNNNYVATPPTTAGGTFQVRRTRASATDPPGTAFLSDQSLVGGPVSFSQDLQVSGTLSFTNPNNVDPNIFLGFYNSSNLYVLGTSGTATLATGSASAKTARLGLTMADSAIGAFRFQTGANSYSSGSNTGGAATTNNLNSTGGGTAATATPVTAGTYAFSLNYTASSRALAAVVGPVSRTFTLPATFGTSGATLDSFGFLQLGDVLTGSFDLSKTFTYSITDVEYTGGSPVPEPSCLLLAGLGLPMMVARVRRQMARG